MGQLLYLILFCINQIDLSNNVSFKKIYNSIKPVDINYNISIVPKPSFAKFSQQTFTLEKCELIFKVHPSDNEIISTSIGRFIKNAFVEDKFLNFDNFMSIRLVTINYKICDPNSNYFVNESYKIHVNETGIIIQAETCVGVVRALDTLMQLVQYNPIHRIHTIRSLTVIDSPRFAFRGFLLDTSRHFLPVADIKTFLDIAGIAKLNVFHWHIVDDQSFPYVSEKFPNISQIGTSSRLKRYSQQDISNIIRHARNLGIWVMPEFDTPGHTSSWLAIPNFNTLCSNSYGPTDPTIESNYQFLNELFAEIKNVFQFKFMHLGGDEVDMKCWMSVKRIIDWMYKHGKRSGGELQTYYIQRLLNISKRYWTNSVVWQEVFFSTKSKFDKSMIVNVWTSNENNKLTKDVVNAGHQVIVGSCWYLNIISTYEDWNKWYKCDPHEGIEQKFKHLVLGGTISMWGEKVVPANLVPRSWARSLVPAERLWSAENVKNETDFKNRGFILYCRLLRLGYSVSDFEYSRECPMGR